MTKRTKLIVVLISLMVLHYFYALYKGNIQGEYISHHGHGYEFIVINDDGSYLHGFEKDTIKKLDIGSWHFDTKMFGQNELELTNWRNFIRNGNIINDSISGIYTTSIKNDIIQINPDDYEDNYNFFKRDNE